MSEAGSLINARGIVANPSIGEVRRRLSDLGRKVIFIFWRKVRFLPKLK